MALEIASSKSQLIVNVAVLKPLDMIFTYLVPEFLGSKIKRGAWVKVPFGDSNRIVPACLLEDPKPLACLAPHLTSDLLKSIKEVEENEMICPSDVFFLCQWAHDYYGTPMGEILQSAIPACVFKTFGRSKSKKNRPQKVFAEGAERGEKILTKAQITAVETLSELFGKDTKQKTGVLHGVTGSGKTEVYLELAKRALGLGKSVLILVPEIALTSQLHRRFEESLCVKVGIWHSALPAKWRKEHFFETVQGKINVMVGARSAVFAPLRDLGLIVVDEEHDPTYKQEDRARYNARDLAVVRGKMTGAVVILGSATPSMETRERVHELKYSLATMEHRIAVGGLPSIQLVDMCTAEKVPGLQANLAVETVESIRDTLSKQEQVILFLNRRGFAASLICEDCGTVSQCKNCSISLTVHRRHSQLRCHVCGYQVPIPSLCVKCLGHRLKPLGAGTESIEEELPSLIPEAKILRLDRDHITSASRLERILNAFRKGEANILLGTQMLVKGHDFSNVTLVVVVLADALFRWPDFRAPERALQVLKQVSGRAGRGEKLGHVMIQTYDTENKVLKVLQGVENEESFLDSERILRKELSYPPFGRLCRIRVEAKNQKTAALHSETLVRALLPISQKFSFDILGPSEAFLEKAKGSYRWDILVKSKEVSGVQMAVKTVKIVAPPKKIKFFVDVDPLGIG